MILTQSSEVKLDQKLVLTDSTCVRVQPSNSLLDTKVVRIPETFISVPYLPIKMLSISRNSIIRAVTGDMNSPKLLKTVIKPRGVSSQALPHYRDVTGQPFRWQSFSTVGDNPRCTKTYFKLWPCRYRQEWPLQPWGKLR